jgi:phage/plasmid-associated DNA primase
MQKYKIRLKGGIMDFSGNEIIYRENIEAAMGPVLPYTISEVREAGKPEGFLKFMESNFPDTDTRETMLYYLSLIPAMETDFKYCGVFFGGYATGKTATIEVMREVLPGYFENIPGEFLFRRRGNDPLLFPDLEGKGAGVVSEYPYNSPICTSLIKTLVGGDTISTRGLYQAPKTYVPTTQIIICTNKVIDFGEYDEAMENRLLVIPFLSKHERGDPQTKTFSQIFIDIQSEFPGIVRLLVEYYIRLKNEFGGKIAESHDCLKYKKRFIKTAVTA